MESSVRIEEAAADWIARRAGGGWNADAEAELDAWLAASTAHRVAFVRLDAAWREAARLKVLDTGAGLPKPGHWNTQGSPVAAQAVPPTLRPAAAGERRRAWALAASLVLTLALGATAYFASSPGETYTTVVGGLQTIPLPDGSQVTLNTETEIRISITERERRADLASGEAYRAGDHRVVVVGTKFSVMRDGETFRVFVTEGSVRVEQDGTEAPATQLAPGQIARARDAGLLVQAKQVSEVEEYLSWRSGYLVFRETTLGEAVAEFNRYSTRKIVIADPSIASIRIGGNFRSGNMDAFIRLLEEGFPLAVERQSEQVVLKAARGS
jgi:transmembrane sensor